MTRICIIGNSHVASLKTGWDEIKDRHGDCELTFFASPKRNMNNLEIKDDVLRPTTVVLRKNMKYTSGGLGQIAPNDYDAIVIYGLGLRVPRLDKRLSRAVLEQTLKDNLFQSLNYRTAMRVRSACPLPIFMGHNPMHAASEDAEQATTFMSYAEVMDELTATMDIAAVKLVSQPAATVASDWFTKSQYAKGAKRLAIKDKLEGALHDEDQQSHMGTEFGKLYLEDLFRLVHARLSAGSGAHRLASR